MPVEHIELLVEEASLEAGLRALLPKIIGNISFEIYAYQGKADLLKKLPSRLAGYKTWLPPTYKLFVLIDRDDDDCVNLKNALEKMASDAGLSTRTNPSHDGSFAVINRIVIEELEAWFFGDWTATLTAYPRCPKNLPSRAKYRNPDRISGGTWEALERVLQRAGYFKGGMGKIEASRTISQYLDPANNTSLSFNQFRNALLAVIEG